MTYASEGRENHSDIPRGTETKYRGGGLPPFTLLAGRQTSTEANHNRYTPHKAIRDLFSTLPHGPLWDNEIYIHSHTTTPYDQNSAFRANECEEYLLLLLISAYA